MTVCWGWRGPTTSSLFSVNRCWDNPPEKTWITSSSSELFSNPFLLQLIYDPRWGNSEVANWACIPIFIFLLEKYCLAATLISQHYCGQKLLSPSFFFHDALLNLFALIQWESCWCLEESILSKQQLNFPYSSTLLWCLIIFRNCC